VPPKPDGKPGDDGKSTTAAGRKTARKTAHSLIERRRRFKMNEEFGVLKGMIPACRGVEMHKLAILQVFYLLFHGRDHSMTPQPNSLTTFPRTGEH
jgi:hypothetical protein